MKFCSECGADVALKIPAGDNRERAVCTVCDTIHYSNPRIIAGCLPVWGQQVLLCKRAIEPRLGYWTLPAGFMENGETVPQAAGRETVEEANARVSNLHLYAVFSLPHISQVYMFYRAELDDLDFSAGEESLEVALFDEQDIPWDNLAFPVMTKTLKRYFDDRKTGLFPTTDEVVEFKRRPRS